MNETVTRIPLAQVKPHPANRRVGGFDQVKLEQLAESIKSIGVQQPAVVRPRFEQEPAYYEIVAGERRWRASAIAGVPDLPCIIRDLDDTTALKIQTVENLQREDVHPLDEADGYQRLIDEASYDIDRLASELGKSASYVYQRLKLRELTESARGMFIEGEFSAGHAILIARLQPLDQEEVVTWFAKQSQWGVQPGVRELSVYIQRALNLELAKATFKLDDANLVPAAGPCTLCPKRSGYLPSLFADVSKNDLCLDKRCYDSKIQALVDRRREELKNKGQEAIEAASDYLGQSSDDGLKSAGVLSRSQWEPCRAKDDGATRILLVAGSEAGTVTWGKKREVNRYGTPEKTSEQKERDREARETAKRERAIREAAYELLQERIRTLTRPAYRLPLEILRQIAYRMFDDLDHNTRQAFATMHGFERPPKKDGQENWNRPQASDVMRKMIAEYDEEQLLLLLVRCLVAGDVIVGSSYRPELDPALRAVGEDPQSVRGAAALAYDAEREER